MEEWIIRTLTDAKDSVAAAHDAETPEAAQAHALLSIASSLVAIAEMMRFKG